MYYEFNKDGLYRLVIEDNFRSGIEAVAYEIDYVKPAPGGTLHGVDDGGHTNGAVRFTWTDEAAARLTCGGKITDYVSGTEITEEGIYLLEFTDVNGYSRTYTFTVDRTVPTGVLTNAVDCGITNKVVSLTFTKDSAAGALYKYGQFICTYESGAEITADGEYKIVLTDKAFNKTEYAFTIDTVKPEATLSGVDNGGKAGGSVTLKNPNKQCDVKVYKDGAEFAYNLGDVLTQEGAVTKSF